MSEHTKEPWFVRKLERNGEIIDCFVAAKDVNGFAYDADILGDDEYRDGIERKLADARRIVACVNACVGIPTAILDAGNSVADAVREFKQQRDALLTQLKAVNELFESGDWSVTRGDGRMTLPYEQAEKVAEDVEKLVKENEA